MSLEQALRYAEYGMALVPVSHRSKVANDALIKKVYGKGASWSILSERPASPAEIREWFTLEPTSGIGVLCGAASGGLVVADFDKPSSIEMPLTPTASTGRGTHVYFKSESVTKTVREEWGDFKASGYVVMPPSLHPSGVAYSWITSPDEADFAPLKAFTDLVLTPRGNAPWCEALDLAPDVDLDLRSRPGLTAVPLEWWDAYPPFVTALASLTGMSLTGNFPCPIHREERASASMYRADSGTHLVRCFHLRGKPTNTLSQAYASTVTGRDMSALKGASHSAWKLRALHQTKMIVPDSVLLPPLPGSPSDAAHRLWRDTQQLRDSAALLFTLKLALHGDPHTTLARSFMCPWTGLPETRLHHAMRALLEQRVIVKTGKHGMASVYAPGDVV